MKDFYNKLEKADRQMAERFGCLGMYERCINEYKIYEKVHKKIAKGNIKHILEFLVEWKTRGITPKGQEGRRITTALEKALKYIKTASIPIRGKSLDSICFNEKENKSIEDMYNRLDNIRRFGPTATSKVLHLLFPDLFVMWDKKIREYYVNHKYIEGSNAKLYISFLQLMQLQAKLFSSKHKRKMWIIKIKRTPSIPKLIDEYNYLTYTKETKL